MRLIIAYFMIIASILKFLDITKCLKGFQMERKCFKQKLFIQNRKSKAKQSSALRVLFSWRYLNAVPLFIISPSTKDISEYRRPSTMQVVRWKTRIGFLPRKSLDVKFMKANHNLSGVTRLKSFLQAFRHMIEGEAQKD